MCPPFRGQDLPAPDIFNAQCAECHASATTATAVVAAIPIAVCSVAAVGIRHYERRNGAIPAESADEFCVASVDCCGEIRVLRGLARLELEGLVFSLKRRNLVLSEEVENCVCAVALRVYNITGRAIDCVRDVTSALREIVVHAVDCALRLAAAVLEVEAEVGNARVDAVEALTKRLLYSCLTEFKVVEVVQDSAVVESDSHVVGRCQFADVITELGISATEAIAAPAVVAPAEKQKNQNPCPIATEETVAVAVAVGSVTTSKVAAHEAVIIFVHNFVSFWFYLICVRTTYFYELFERKVAGVPRRTFHAV